MLRRLATDRSVYAGVIQVWWLWLLLGAIVGGWAWRRMRITADPYVPDTEYVQRAMRQLQTEDDEHAFIG